MIKLEIMNERSEKFDLVNGEFKTLTNVLQMSHTQEFNEISAENYI